MSEFGSCSPEVVLRGRTRRMEWLEADNAPPDHEWMGGFEERATRELEECGHGRVANQS